MSTSEKPLNLYDPVVKTRIFQAYQLLIQLAEDAAADSEDLPQDPELPAAPDSDDEAPSQPGA